VKWSTAVRTNTFQFVAPWVTLALAILPRSLAQELLPTIDPPEGIKVLTRHTSDFRKDYLRQAPELSHAPAEQAWKLVHACVQKDPGKIKALKLSFSREFQNAERDPWRAYALAIQAFHLHHAGEFPNHLRDSLSRYVQAWDRDLFDELDSDRPFATGPLALPTASCAAAFLSAKEIQTTHDFVRLSLDRLRTTPPVELININATLQSALLTGRAGEFKNETWKVVFDDLRDLVPPNGCLPLVGMAHEHEILFSDVGAALRIGAVLFGDPTYLYAANKYQAATMTDDARPSRSLSPIQWAYLNYDQLDQMPSAVPPSRSLLRRRVGTDGKPGSTLSLRTGNHPRAAALLATPGANDNTCSAPREVWVGGSRFTPRAGQPASANNIFLITPSAHDFLARNEAPTAYLKHSGLEIAEDAEQTTMEDRSGDTSGRFVFSNYIVPDARLSRRLVLTREGIMVIADHVEAPASFSGQTLGPIWNLNKGSQASGPNWFAYNAYEHFLPPGYRGEPRAALVWFAPQEGMTIEEMDRTACQKASGKPGPSNFLTVIVPYQAGLSPTAIAKAISAGDLKTVTVGKVTVDLTGDTWKVTRR